SFKLLSAWRMKRCLRHFFAERRCFVFPRPADVPDLKNMEKLPEEKLDPLFLQQSKEFCKHVHSSAKPKTVPGGRTVIGSVLGGLAEVYVEAIRRGDVPCLENAVETLAQIQNEKAVEQDPGGLYEGGSELYPVTNGPGRAFPETAAALILSYKIKKDKERFRTCSVQ
uniref:GB1/RHD3-type G domain-containing protein n=1 Tax=Astyanax mexicanus TaxID=7994 RepID=A0A3B1IGL6_ASTMX